MLVTLLGYQTLGWGDFPYKDYCPNYLSPYWWEVFVNPLWGAVIAFGLPCHYLGQLFGGQGSWMQVFAFVLLALVVSLPIFLLFVFFMLLVRNHLAIIL